MEFDKFEVICLQSRRQINGKSIGCIGGLFVGFFKSIYFVTVNSEN